jgi:hypothetical protein
VRELNHERGEPDRAVLLGNSREQVYEIGKVAFDWAIIERYGPSRLPASRGPRVSLSTTYEFADVIYGRATKRPPETHQPFLFTLASIVGAGGAGESLLPPERRRSSSAERRTVSVFFFSGSVLAFFGSLG